MNHDSKDVKDSRAWLMAGQKPQGRSKTPESNRPLLPVKEKIMKNILLYTEKPECRQPMILSTNA